MKSEVKNINSSTTSVAAAADPAGTTPEQVIEQIRAIRASIPAGTPLSPEQRQRLRNNVKVSHEVLRAQINVIDVSDRIESALGQPPDAVRDIVSEHDRWIAVETELRSLLAGVSNSNLLRAQKLQLIGAQAYVIGVSLARSEDNVDLAAHVAEVRRLKRNAKRKKPVPASPPPQEPSPAGGPAPTGT